MTGALGRYRAMADVVGVALMVLVFVGMPLEYGAGTSTLVQVLGPIHGLLYIVYLLTAIDLSRRAQLRWPWMLAMAAAGLVPFVAFIVERRVTRLVSQNMPEQLPA